MTTIPVRDARDRLIELLSLGEPYPLRDLGVSDDQLTVPFNTSAKIPIENSQPGVLYQLHDKSKVVERAPGELIEIVGNGGTVVLETYKIQEDITFRIFAMKQSSQHDT